MNDPEATTRSEPTPMPPATAIEALLAAYLLAAESGAAPRLQDYLVQLATLEQRDQFVDLLDQVAFAERHLPLRLEAQVVLSGRYELVEAIGSGGMGQVWKALDRKLGHHVAVKVLSLAATAALDVDHLVEREGKLLARLSHPGVVRIQDTGRDGEHRFLVMDLIGGDALDALIDRLLERRQQEARKLTAMDLLALVGPPPAGRDAVLVGNEAWPIAVTRIVIELLRTLEATHGVGIVHRDLKPGNVRIIGGGFPVLLDFGIGLATGVTPGRLTASMFGTVQYAAPEQWDGSERTGVHTDVYQAGVVLYELLTLQRCFRGETPIEMMRAVRDASYKKPRELDHDVAVGLEACVLRAMEVDPARRYRSAAEFRTDLERFLAGEIPHAAAPLATVSWRVRSFGRRHRRSLSLAAAALVGALGFWWMRGEPGPVQWVAADTVSVRLDEPAMLLAFRIARDVGGACWCAPLRLDDSQQGPARGAFVRTLPAGTTKVSLHDVADRSRLPGTVSTILVDPADAVARRRFDSVVEAMKRAGRLVEDRNGEWLPEKEFRELFSPGRGSGASGVPVDRLFAVGEWQANGLRGCVISP